jgi:hypothetical protein
MAKSRGQTPPRAGVGDPKSEPVGQYHQPSARECALLILGLMQARAEEVVDREVSRVRISQSTLRNLCGRSQITNDLLLEVQEFLLAAGWCLFCAGPTHYALIKKKAVEGWGRISSGRIKDDLTAVSLGRGKKIFERLEPLLMPQESDTGDSDE